MACFSIYIFHFFVCVAKYYLKLLLQWQCCVGFRSLWDHEVDSKMNCIGFSL